MILTSRDQALLMDLHGYAILSTRKLAARHFPGVALTTVLRRLRALEASGYIQRISCLAGGGNVWALTKIGAERFAPAASKIHFPRFILDHDLKLTDLRLHLEDTGIARSWRPEHEIRARVARRHGVKNGQDRTVPDGLMGVDVSGLQETVAVELELSPKNQDRYRRIFREYETKTSLWGVWYVVANASLGNQVLKVARQNWYRDQRPHFFCTLLSELMNDPLNAKAYGHSKTHKIGDLWRPRPVEPAHAPAQGVSSLDPTSFEKSLDLNAEEDGESLTPAS